MASGQRPRQPRTGGEHDRHHERERSSRTEPRDTAVNVKVNDGSKVFELDGERYETVPTGGGRFSAWRRDVLQDGEAGGTGQGAGPLSPEQHRRRRRKHGLIGAAIALVLCLLLVWVVFFSPLLAVRSIEVEGADLTDAQEVREQLSEFEGVPMTRISERAVMDSVGELPQVRSVTVQTMPDNRLVVQLTERVPVAAVEDGDSWSLVDQDGTVLRTVSDQEEVTVPVIEGGADVLGTEEFTSVAEVLSTLPSSLLEQVSSARAESNSTVDLELDGEITVRWGDSSRGALKAEVLAQLVEASDQTGAVSIYDVSSPEHPVLE